MNQNEKKIIIRNVDGLQAQIKNKEMKWTFQEYKLCIFCGDDIINQMDLSFGNFFSQESASFYQQVLQMKEPVLLNQNLSQTDVCDKVQCFMLDSPQIEFPQKNSDVENNEYFGEEQSFYNLNTLNEQGSHQIFSIQSQLNQKNISESKDSQSSYEEEEVSEECEKKDKIKHTTKNILVNFKSHFVEYIQENFPEARKDKFLVDFKKKSCINRKDYEDLFRIQRYRGVINRMFEERYLQREFQISRASFQVRDTYLRKIPVFRKAFEVKKFPRIC